uniref:WH2 domain-containing protein n=1 Tax=Parastrongyloides trichosuri TaxID=131310 RepID=A0A0N5A1H5_PARTI
MEHEKNNEKRSNINSRDDGENDDMVSSENSDSNDILPINELSGCVIGQNSKSIDKVDNQYSTSSISNNNNNYEEFNDNENINPNNMVQNNIENEEELDEDTKLFRRLLYNNNDPFSNLEESPLSPSSTRSSVSSGSPSCYEPVISGISRMETDGSAVLSSNGRKRTFFNLLESARNEILSSQSLRIPLFVDRMRVNTFHTNDIDVEAQTRRDNNDRVINYNNYHKRDAIPSSSCLQPSIKKKSPEKVKILPDQLDSKESRRFLNKLKSQAFMIRGGRVRISPNNGSLSNNGKTYTKKRYQNNDDHEDSDSSV